MKGEILSIDTVKELEQLKYKLDKYKIALDKIKEIISKIDFNDKNEWIPPKQLEPILELLEEIE